MTDYFPGSRLPVTPPGGLRDVLGGLTGKKYPTPLGEVELFTISELSQVLNRTPVAIRKWEREGVIPKATYSKPGKNKDPRGRRRLYSRAQVEAMVQIAETEGILYNKNKQISRTQFKQKVHAAFREIAGKR